MLLTSFGFPDLEFVESARELALFSLTSTLLLFSDNFLGLFWLLCDFFIYVLGRDSSLASFC